MSRSTEEAQAHAALYAHGVLSEKEMQELQDSEKQLTDRSVAEILTTDIKAFETVVRDLGYVAPPQQPSEALRSRVPNRIEEEEKVTMQEQMSSIVENSFVLYPFGIHELERRQ